MKFKILIISLLCLLFLNNCSSIKEAGKILRNEKVNSTDEFLIKKKEPLTLPPDFDKIPSPGTLENIADKESKTVKEILSIKTPKSVEETNQLSSTEKSILNQIKK